MAGRGAREETSFRIRDTALVLCHGRQGVKQGRSRKAGACPGRWVSRVSREEVREGS